MWVIIIHFLNIFFMLLLARSGLEMLSAFPKLYWRGPLVRAQPGRRRNARAALRGAGIGQRQLLGNLPRAFAHALMFEGAARHARPWQDLNHV